MRMFNYLNEELRELVKVKKFNPFNIAYQLAFILVLFLVFGDIGSIYAEESTGEFNFEKTLQEIRMWKTGDMEETMARVNPALVFIRHRDGFGMLSSGSGFFVSPDGLIATCAHVIKSSSLPTTSKKVAEKIWIRPFTGSTQEARVIYTNMEIDFALLKVEGSKHPHIGFYGMQELQGQEIAVFGYPGGELLGYEPSITKKFISSIRDNGKILQIDAAVNPGCSGGPVVASGGGVVGLAWAKVRNMEGTNFAVSHIAIPDVLDIVISLVLSDPQNFERSNLVNVHSSTGYNPLQYAVSKGRLDQVKTLLSLGANPNNEANYNITVLDTAVSSGNEAIVQLLIDNGARVTKVDPLGHTSLITAILIDNASLARILIRTGDNPNLKDKIGATPLHLAVRHSKEAMIEMLLAEGASVNTIDNSGCTPLHWAKEKGKTTLADLLRKNGGIDLGRLSWNQIEYNCQSLFSKQMEKVLEQ